MVIIILLPLLTFGVGNPTLHMEDLPGGSSILNMRVESGVLYWYPRHDIPVWSPDTGTRLCASNRNWVAAIKLCFLRSLTPSLSQPIRGQYPRHVISPSQSEAGITPDPWPSLSHSLIATLTSRFLDPNNNPKMVTLPSFWLADNSLARILRNNSTDN